MENIGFLNLNNFVSHNFYVSKILQDEFTVVHLDELDSGMLLSMG